MAEEERESQTLCSHGPGAAVSCTSRLGGSAGLRTRTDHNVETPAGASHSGYLEAKGREGPSVLHVSSWSHSDFVLRVTKTQKKTIWCLEGKIMRTESVRIMPACLCLWGALFYSTFIWEHLRGEQTRTLKGFLVNTVFRLLLFEKKKKNKSQDAPCCSALLRSAPAFIKRA